jgi:hypothetical protein
MIEKATALPNANATVGHMAIRQAAEAPSVLVFSEYITDTADGLDQWPFAFTVDLVAQPVYLYFHYIR